MINELDAEACCSSFEKMEIRKISEDGYDYSPSDTSKVCRRSEAEEGNSKLSSMGVPTSTEPNPIAVKASGQGKGRKGHGHGRRRKFESKVWSKIKQARELWRSSQSVADQKIQFERTVEALNMYHNTLDTLENKKHLRSLYDIVVWELASSLNDAGQSLQACPPVDMESPWQIHLLILRYFRSCQEYIIEKNWNTYAQEQKWLRMAAVTKRNLGSEYFREFREIDHMEPVELEEDMRELAKDSSYADAAKCFDVAVELFEKAESPLECIRVHMQKKQLLLESQAEECRLKNAFFHLLKCEKYISEKRLKEEASREQVEKLLKDFLEEIVQLLKKIVAALDDRSNMQEKFRFAYRLLVEVSQESKSPFVQKLESALKTVSKKFTENERCGM